MKRYFLIRNLKCILAFLILISLIQGKNFCQSTQNPGQHPQQKSQALTPQQTATVKNILSKYDPSKLTSADAKAIHEKLREADLHGGPETNDAIRAAGFDPDKLRTLDPPPDEGKQGQPGQPGPPSMEERMKNVETNIIKPLALNATQSDVVMKAFRDFYSEMETLKKSLGNTQGPLDKSKVEPIEKKRDDKIKQVLSADQFKKYLELEKASRPHKDDAPGNKQK